MATIHSTIISGAGASTALLPLLSGKTRILLVTDQNVGALEATQAIHRLLAAEGRKVEVIDTVPAEPSHHDVAQIVSQLGASQPQMIVGIGGGSVLDVAKLLSVLLHTEAPSLTAMLAGELPQRRISSLLIPATAGTGSEATPNAIVAVPEKELKIGIVNEEMMADYVILDVRMVAKLPRKIAAATGVDALAHAIECWTSNKANPFSGLFAMHALDLLLNNLLPACNEQDMQARQNVQLASFLAGVAITASGTTAVHALSYPLGGKYHIAHGISNAILLAPVMRFNEPACRALLAQAYDTCVHGEKTCETQAEKSSYIIAWLEKIVKDLDIPTSLSVFSVPAEDLESLVEAGLSVKRLLNNNMREVTADDAREIYRSIL